MGLEQPHLCWEHSPTTPSSRTRGGILTQGGYTRNLGLTRLSQGPSVHQVLKGLNPEAVRLVFITCHKALPGRQPEVSHRAPGRQRQDTEDLQVVFGALGRMACAHWEMNLP